MTDLAARLLPLAFAAIDDVDAALVLYDAVEESWEELRAKWPRWFADHAHPSAPKWIVLEDMSWNIYGQYPTHWLTRGPSWNRATARAIAAVLLCADWSTEMWPVARRALAMPWWPQADSGLWRGVNRKPSVRLSDVDVQRWEREVIDVAARILGHGHGPWDAPKPPPAPPAKRRRKTKR